MSKVKELAEKYELTKDDFWKHKQSGKWIITHDACMKIANKEGIVFHEPYKEVEGEIVPTFSYTPQNCWIYATATLKDKTVWTFGTANPINCKMSYMELMAEKRLKDRLTLKLINAYEYGIYSEVEADEFKKPKDEPEIKIAPRPATKSQLNLITQLELNNNVKGNKCIDFKGLSVDKASKYIDSFNRT